MRRFVDLPDLRFSTWKAGYRRPTDEARGSMPRKIYLMTFRQFWCFLKCRMDQETNNFFGCLQLGKDDLCALKIDSVWTVTGNAERFFAAGSQQFRRDTPWIVCVSGRAALGNSDLQLIWSPGREWVEAEVYDFSITTSSFQRKVFPLHDHTWSILSNLSISIEYRILYPNFRPTENPWRWSLPVEAKVALRHFVMLGALGFFLAAKKRCPWIWSDHDVTIWLVWSLAYLPSAIIYYICIHL